MNLTQDTINVLKDCCIVTNEFPTKVFSPELNNTFAENTLDMVSTLSLHTGSGQVNMKDGWINDVFGNSNDTFITITSKVRT